MTPLLLFITIPTVIGIFLAKRDGGGADNYFAYLFISLFIAFIIGVAFFIILWVITQPTKDNNYHITGNSIESLVKTHEYTYDIEINAVKDIIGTSGKIIGGIYYSKGYIDSTLYYFYSEATDKGDITKRIPENYTYIVYSDDEDPHITVHAVSYKPTELLKALTPFTSNKYLIDYYVITVPTSAKNYDYSIDLQ